MDNLLHDYYNAKLKSEEKKHNAIIEQLHNEITKLKTDVVSLKKVNHSLKCKLSSANNMIRILTSNRESYCDFTKVDRLLRATLIEENNYNADTANNNNNCQDIPKKIDFTKNVDLMRDQNKPDLQSRNCVKTLQSEVTSSANVIKMQNPKVKPAAPTIRKIGTKPLATETSRIPVSTNLLKKNLEDKNKEKVAPSKNKTLANRKGELAGTISDIKKSKGNTLLTKGMIENRPKIVKKNPELKMVSKNKTFLVDK